MQQEIVLTLGECLNGNIPFIASIAPLPRAPSGPLQNRPALQERAGALRQNRRTDFRPRR